MAKREGNRNFVPVAMTDEDLKKLERLVTTQNKGRSTLMRLALRYYSESLEKNTVTAA